MTFIKRIILQPDFKIGLITNKDVVTLFTW